MATLCHRGWLLTETIGDLQSAMWIVLFTCSKRLVEVRGSTRVNQSFRSDCYGYLIPYRLACEQRVQCGSAFLSKWCILKQFCFVRLLATWLWALDNFTIKFWHSFRPCMCIFSIIRRVYIICFVVASFALWFCHCGILLSIALTLTYDDIEILRWHIKLGNNELKRQLATNDRRAAGAEATELFSAEFHPNVTTNTENGVAKTHGSSNWFEGWLCARKRRCRFDFCQCEMTRGKIVLDGKSKENLEKKCGIQFFFLVFLSFWTARAYPKLKQQQKIRFRRRLALFEQKNGSGFGQKAVRFWGNLSPTLRKSVTDFGENPSPTLGKSAHRLWGSPSTTLGKSATDFGKICHRLWENQPPTLGKSATDFGKIRHRFWGKSVTDFEEVSHRFWGNASPILGKSVADFGDISHRLWGKIGSVLGKFGEIGLVFGLACDKAQVSLSWTPSMFGFGCHYKGKTAGGKLEG